MKVTVEEGKNLIFDSFSPINESKKVPVDESVGSVLNRPLIAERDHPNVNISRFDGYAVKSDDLKQENELEVVEKSKLEVGECKRANTGGRVPENADFVVMVENVTEQDGTIVLNKLPSSKHIIEKGSNIKEGDEILPSEREIDEINIGAFPTLEKEQAEVYRKAKIAILATGDEITPKNDVNSRLLRYIVEKNGGVVEEIKRVKDSEKKIKNTLLKLTDSNFDFILSIGGTSKGKKDLIETVISEIGKIIFNQINTRPGKTFTFSKVNDVSIFSFSGNVTPFWIQANLFLAPALRRLNHLFPRSTKKLRLDKTLSPESHKILSKGVCNILPAKKVDENRIKPIFGKYMTILPLLRSDHLMIIDEGEESLGKDEEVTAIPVKNLRSRRRG